MSLGWMLYAAVNTLVFVLYGVDKRRGRRGMWRISERTLLTGAWCMGGVGAWLGMRAFHHKTRHAAFAIGVPIAAGIQLLLMGAVTLKLWGLL